MSDEDANNLTYTVVVNDEEQYSIWLAGSELPAGWRAVGVTGSKDQCLDHIELVWTDMRPLSVRKWIDSAGSEVTT
jgi:MbtH protein